MELEIKKRAVSNTINRARADAPVTTPSIVDLKSNEVNPEELSKETSENVMKIFSVLENIGSFPFYQFITDPRSFARTVENLFYVSFLIKDNRARIFVPEIATQSKELYIEAILPGDEEEESYKESVETESDDQDHFNQLVLGMTTTIWRKTIDKYKIERPFFVLS